MNRNIFVFTTAAILLAAGLLAGRGIRGVSAQNEPARIAIDYPLDGSVFPPDMAPPTFQWRDTAPNADSWQIEVSFADGAAPLLVSSKGELMRIGAIDPRAVADTNKPPELTPEQAAAHTFKPDTATWGAIRQHAVSSAATITIRGFATGAVPVSSGSMKLSISTDPVGAPIFYRDVPLMPSETEKGFIKPLASSAIPLIEWRMRNVAETGSHIVMTDLHSCANCHSFAANGKTLGLDLDGPQNDKGMYTLVPVNKQMTIRNQDVISWSSFPTESGSPVRVGFMSQVSPDGRYVVTTIRPPGSKSSSFYYVANFKDYRFLQVFYPTRGILAWYDRETKKFQPLPGADDPRFVQASAVWSPDGKYLVFARAEAREPFRADGKLAAYANDPTEVPIQYDLYRIPFNHGLGGKPEPIAGASQNGMSNSFAKISPDGKWMVFVQAHNGQLMRPDSQLYIVPAAGGEARRMTCNTALMNSWHSFSPNGRWLVFSSKSRSPYTQMFLTHIDEEGRDSPPIFIENSTAANRAVNIPEFVNIAQDGLVKIDVPAADFYRLFDSVVELGEKGQWESAVAGWRKVLEIEPENAKAHNNLAVALIRRGALDEGIAHFREATRIKPGFERAHFNLGVALYQKGDLEQAVAEWRETVALNPDFAEAYRLIGVALAELGKGK